MSDLVITGSLRPDGKRRAVEPDDVRGRYTLRRRILYAFLIAIYVSLPFIPIGGHPAVFLDVANGHFYLFGATFNAQDVWLLFFLVSGLGFLLFVLTAVAGRVWCGYACPQTVFLDGVYRRIERLVEGNRRVRIRRNAGPWTLDKTWRKLVKHALYLAVTLALVHVFLSYFVSMPSLADMVTGSPGAHPTAFAFVMVTTALIYANFAWFREQLCLIICPYGRLQSVMTDRDTINVAYDAGRGEPRGKKSDPNAGDCVDCKRCVAVCPTGIDIRDGLQIDCIGCASCIDACDEIMAKVGRDAGLIRYESLRGLDGEGRRWWRPRIALYCVLGAAGLVAAFLGVRAHAPYEAKLLRVKGLPYVLDGDDIRNSFELHVVNKTDAEQTYDLVPPEGGPAAYTLGAREVTLPAMGEARVPIVVVIAYEAWTAGMRVELRIAPRGDPDEARTVTANLAGPG